MTAQLDQRSSDTSATGRSWASRLVSPLAFAVLGALTCVVVTVFRIWPELDLMTAAWFYDAHYRFVATETADLMRVTLYITPWIVIGTILALCAASGSKIRGVWAPCRQGLAMLTLSLALGPGLLVNGILKDFVHRPRPHQIAEFGGSLPFQPAGNIEGDCPRNCSFVSGEVSATAWTLAVALLVPISIQPAAVTAAVILTGVAGLWRMAVGAHFLSDALLAAMFTWLVVIVTWWAVFGPSGSAREATASSRTRAAA